MSDYFQQLRQQTGIRFATEPQGPRAEIGLESPLTLNPVPDLLPVIEVVDSSAPMSPTDLRAGPQPRLPWHEPFQSVTESHSLEIPPNLAAVQPTAEPAPNPSSQSNPFRAASLEWQAESRPSVSLESAPLDIESTQISIPGLATPELGSLEPSPAPPSLQPLPPSTLQLTLQTVREWLTAVPDPVLATQSPLESPEPALRKDRGDPEFRQLTNPSSPSWTFPGVPTSLPAPESPPESLQVRAASASAPTQDFTLSIGRINVTIEAPLPNPALVPPPPVSAPASSSAPFSTPSRLSRYYLRVR
jgi:hypothetical protein